MIKAFPMKMILLFLCICSVILSCGKREGFEFSEATNLGLDGEKYLTFDDLKSRILIPHCISCHKKSDTEDGIKNWFIPGQPENSKLYLVIKDGRMPKKADPLPTSELEFVRKYIIDALEQKKLSTVDFNTLRNEILIPHCLSCHKRMDNEENITKWINLKSPLESRLLQAVVEGKMPKKADPLSINEQNIIRRYLNNFLIKENE